MSDFKSQLQAFVNEAAEEKYILTNINHNLNANKRYAFKQGCDLLIPVLMRAIEQRNQNAYGYPDYENEQLLNILKGEK